MTLLKCEHCGNEKLLITLIRDYKFKRRVKADQKIVYFCSYDCMRKAEKENPERYCERK